MIEPVTPCEWWTPVTGTVARYCFSINFQREGISEQAPSPTEEPEAIGYYIHSLCRHVGYRKCVMNDLEPRRKRRDKDRFEKRSDPADT